MSLPMHRRHMFKAAGLKPWSFLPTPQSHISELAMQLPVWSLKPKQFNSSQERENLPFFIYIKPAKSLYLFRMELKLCSTLNK